MLGYDDSIQNAIPICPCFPSCNHVIKKSFYNCIIRNSVTKDKGASKFKRSLSTCI